MTKKHFIKLAECLRYNRNSILIERGFGGHVNGNDLTPASSKDPVVHAWKMMVESIASVCAQTNERFDRARFLAACGLEG